MAQGVIFLESYVESTGTLPLELQRVLNNIKALDLRCAELSQDLQHNVEALLSMPPAHAQPGGPSAQYNELNSRVASDQKMLMQFAEEKVMLSKQAHDLLEMHALELERVLDDLDKELKRNNPELDWADAGLDYLDNQRGKTPRPADDWGSLQEPLPPMPSALQGVMSVPAQKRGGGIGGPRASHKRLREDGDMGLGSGGPASKKKSSTAAGFSLATQSSYDDLSALGGGAAVGAVSGYGTAAEGVAGGGDDGGVHGGGSAVLDPTAVPFMKPPPPGYKASATRPQAAGARYLVATDIGPTLIGRHAELYWPDDNLWYLIEIQEVYVDRKEARVLYSTGDFETLSLEETARDMHMMLIDDDS